MGGTSSPTVQRRRLGIELRRLREVAGMTIEDAARRLECSLSKISRMETGRVPMRGRDVRDLLELYGVTDAAEQEALVALAHESRKPGWWHSYNDVLPSWFEVRVGLEADAASIRTYQSQLVEGLLQTEEYAHAVIRAAHPNAPADEVERRVALRTARQALLTKDTPPKLWAILDEAVLRRPVGGAQVMRGQLQRLVEATELPNVTLQVLPYSAGAHASMGSAFTILRFPESADLDVIYVEELTSSLYMEKPDDVETYTLAFDHLRATAHSPAESPALIARVAKEL